MYIVVDIVYFYVGRLCIMDLVCFYEWLEFLRFIVINSIVVVNIGFYVYVGQQIIGGIIFDEGIIGFVIVVSLYVYLYYLCFGL